MDSNNEQFEEFSRGNREFILVISNEYKYYISLGSDVYGNIQRIDNCLDKIAEELAPTKSQLENEKIQLKNAEIEAQKEFPQELELQEKQKRLDELNIKLNLNEKDKELFDEDIEEYRNKEKSEKER